MSVAPSNFHDPSPLLATACATIGNYYVHKAVEKGDFATLAKLPQEALFHPSLKNAIAGKHGHVFITLLEQLNVSPIYERVALALIKAGIGLYEQNEQHETALHLCLKNDKIMLFNAIYKASSSQGKETDLLLRKDRQGHPPLYYLKSSKQLICLAKGAEDAPSSLLPVAILHGAREEMLSSYIDSLSKDALSEAGSAGISPLVAASLAGREFLACQILEKQVSDAPCSAGSALLVAIAKGLWNVVDILVEDAQADTILARDSQGKNALVVASHSQREDVVATLLQRLPARSVALPEVYRPFRRVSSLELIRELLRHATDEELFGRDGIGLSLCSQAYAVHAGDLAFEIAQRAKGKTLPRSALEQLFSIVKSSQDPRFLELFIELCPHTILTNLDKRLEDNVRFPQMGLLCLEQACRMKQRGPVEALLQKDVFRNVLTLHTSTLLATIDSITKNNWDDILENVLGAIPQELLLQPKDNSHSFLFHACQQGNEKMAGLLLDRCIQKMQPEQIRDALVQALLKNLDTVSRRLIQAAPEEMLVKEDAQGVSALLITCQRGDEDRALLIIGRLKGRNLVFPRAFAEALKHNLTQVVDKAIDTPPPAFMSLVQADKTLLLICSEQKRPDLALRLIQRGIKDRATASGTALIAAMDNDLHEVVDRLVATSDANTLSAADSRSRCPLYVACKRNLGPLALRLLEKGARDQLTKDNESALTVSIESGLDSVRQKIEEGFSTKNFCQSYLGASFVQHMLFFIRKRRSDVALKLLAQVKFEHNSDLHLVLVACLLDDSTSELSMLLFSRAPGEALMLTFAALCEQKATKLCRELVTLGAARGLSDVTRPLCIAIKNDLDDVADAIVDAFPVSAMTQYAGDLHTPLEQACGKKKEKLLTKLLDKGIDNFPHEASSMIVNALENGLARALTQRLIRISSCITTHTPLLKACSMGYEEEALLILEKRVDDSYPLDLVTLAAFEKKLFKLVEELLKNAKPADISACDQHGRTTLSLSFEHNRPEFAERLFAIGFSHRLPWAQALFHALRQRVAAPLQARIEERATREDLYKALTLAASCDEEASLKLLSRLTLTAREHAACLTASILHGHDRVRAFLMATLTAEVAGLTLADESCPSPLFAAIGKREQALALQLLAMGANTLRSDKDGNTPLHLACMFGLYPVITAMPSSNAVNTKMQTPFDLLLEREDENPELEAAALLLLRKGADISLSHVKGRRISRSIDATMKSYLKELLRDYPELVQHLESSADALSSLYELFFTDKLESTITTLRAKNGPHPIKIALLLRDAGLLKRIAPFTTVGEFFNLLRSDFLENDSHEFRALLLSLFRENLESRKKGVVVAKFPQPPRRVYLHQLSLLSKRLLPRIDQSMVDALARNIRDNLHITATPHDIDKRKAFYEEIATGLKHVIKKLSEEKSQEKWKKFLHEVAGAGAACGIRYEQVTNEQFVTYCMGIDATNPAMQLYNLLGLLRYRILQACAEAGQGRDTTRQDVHLVRDLLLALGDELGIACHRVNQGVGDRYTMLPEDPVRRAAKIDEYRRKFHQGYTLENICDNFLLYPDYQQIAFSFLTDNPPEYWVNEDVKRARAIVQQAAAEQKSEEEVKKILTSDPDFLYPPDWSLGKILKQIRFDAWQAGKPDATGLMPVSFLYEMKPDPIEPKKMQQQMRFVTILETLHAIGVAISDFLKA